MARKVFRIQAQRYDGTWLTCPGDYDTEWEARRSAQTRCAWWRIITGSGTVVSQSPAHR